MQKAKNVFQIFKKIITESHGQEKKKTSSLKLDCFMANQSFVGEMVGACAINMTYFLNKQIRFEDILNTNAMQFLKIRNANQNARKSETNMT